MVTGGTLPTRDQKRGPLEAAPSYLKGYGHSGLLLTGLTSERGEGPMNILPANVHSPTTGVARGCGQG